MGEIVWAKTTKQRDHLKGHVYGEVPADTRITVFASYDKVCMVDSVLVVGKNRKSSKNYYYWRTTHSTGFFRNKGGHLQPYRSVRPLKQKIWKSYFPEVAFYYLEEDAALAAEPMKAFRDACSQYLNLRSVYDLYPMAEVMEMPERFALLPANLRPFMRTTDWSEFMTGAFGKARITPQMIKAAQETEPYVLALAREFRGLVPNSALEKFIIKRRFGEELMDNFQPHTPRVRPFLRKLDTTSINNLLWSPLDVENTRLIKHISDRWSYRQNRNINAPNRVGWVHDWKGLTSLV